MKTKVINDTSKEVNVNVSGQRIVIAPKKCVYLECGIAEELQAFYPVLSYVVMDKKRADKEQKAIKDEEKKELEILAEQKKEDEKKQKEAKAKKDKENKKKADAKKQKEANKSNDKKDDKK